MKLDRLKTRNAIYKTLGTLDKILGREAQHIVLCYHSIADDNFRFSVSKVEFDLQIKTLLKNRKNVDIEEFTKVITGENKTKERTFLLTFDDGYRNLLNIRDIVREHMLKPVIFILPFDAKPDYRELGLVFERLNLQEVKVLIKEGWSIGSHTFTHSNLAELTTQEQKHEIIDSKDSLERDLGSLVSYLAYPKGRYTESCENLAKEADYTLVFTMNDGKISHKTNRYRIPRIGIDRTHSSDLFVNTMQPSNILLRRIVKSLGISGL